MQEKLDGGSEVPVMTIRKGDMAHMEWHLETVPRDRENLQLEQIMPCVLSSPQHFDQSETRCERTASTAWKGRPSPTGQLLQAPEQFSPRGQEIHAAAWDGESLGPQYGPTVLITRVR